jgi:HTH-type transcriptional regulator, quorum sensing regulator NprR
MLEGEIIKFYRLKAGITQEQLGKEICTVSYVSKIELGQTSCSPEIMELLSERLHIDLEKEVSNLKNMENQLHRWHKAIIMQSMKEVEKNKKELESIPFISSSKHAAFYQLLQARYYILKKEFVKADTILQKAQRDYPDLPPYERNLLRHVWGIYYISNYLTIRTENHQKAVKILKEIEKDEYGNLEYYYDLAVAYHCIDSKVLAYVYAEKALRHFKETNNFLKALDAESLMLLQIGKDIHNDFKELVESYHTLIHESELLQALDKKGMFLNNLGYEYFKRKDYASAQKFYKEALNLTDKSSTPYLTRLYNYLESSLEGKLLRKTVLLRRAKEGKTMARVLDNRLFKTIFKLLIYRIEDNLEQYYFFLENNALPYFQSNKYSFFINDYAKQLYNHYMKIEKYDKAAKISSVFTEGLPFEP